MSDSIRLLRARDWALVLVIGAAFAAVSVSAFVATRDQERAEAINAFNDVARERLTHLRGRIDAVLEPLESIVDFLAAVDDLTRRKFSIFSEGQVSRDPSLVALGWVPRVTAVERDAYEAAARADGLAGFQITEGESWEKAVPASPRDEYFPVFYVEPLQGNEPSLGYDVGSESRRRAALDRARDTGEARATRPIWLMQDRGKKPIFLTFHPVYRKGSASATLEQRRANLVGFVRALVDVASLVETTSTEGRDAATDLRLFDATPGEDPMLLASSTLSPNGAHATPASGDEPPTGHAWRQSFGVAGRTWTAAFRPRPGYLEAQETWRPGAVLLIGFAFIGLMSAYLLTTLVRTRRIELLASEVAAGNAALEIAIREKGETENRLRSIVSHLPGMVYRRVLKADGTLEYPYTAGSFLDLLGVDAEQVRKDASVLTGALHPGEFERLRNELAASTRDLTPVDTELHIHLPDGRTRWIRTSSHPYRMENGDTVWDAVAIDVTDRKEAELEQAKLSEQLHAAQKLEAIGQLTGGVAHDFNNLLTVVLGNLELVQRRTTDDERTRRQLETATRAALRGAELTQRLLAFSRRQKLEPKVIGINDHVHGLLDMLRRSLGETIAVEFHPGPDVGTVRVDPGQLESALVNLALNARDAMPKGGKLIIETANVHIDETYAARYPYEMPTGAYVMLAVSDTGTGMTAEVVDRAFEPFFTTKEKGKGTGLGLSMVYGFVKQSGGHVNLYSEVNQGTTVRLYFPAEAAAAAAGEPAPERPERLVGHETILVVEDDPGVRETALAMLTELGYQVIEAKDGATALQVLEQTPGVDLVFSDVVMPGGMSGVELANEIRTRFGAKKVLLCSGYSEAVVRGRSAVPDDCPWLTKPYGRNDLAHKVRQALDG